MCDGRTELDAVGLGRRADAVVHVGAGEAPLPTQAVEAAARRALHRGVGHVGLVLLQLTAGRACSP